jgi:single-strand DNA-binding protein
MAVDNTVTLTGNVTRDPELRYTPGGAAVANFGLAVNRRWQKDGEWEEAVSFFDVTTWQDLAENVSTTVAKGMRVTVTGRLDQRSWETDDGDKRSKIEVVADDVGVSLRWATAEVARTSTGDHGDQPQRSKGKAKKAPEYNPDEEPFVVPAEEWWPGFHGPEWPERILP